MASSRRRRAAQPRVSLPRLPTVRKLDVYHVGELEVENPIKLMGRKPHFTYEWTGLSVSDRPGLWRRILRSGDKPTWRVYRADGRAGRFVDFLRIPERKEAEVLLMAENLGIIEIGRGWAVNFPEDGHGFVSVDCEEVMSEVQEALDNERAIEIKEIQAAYPTTFFREMAYSELHEKAAERLFRTPALVAQFAIYEVIEGSGAYDGIWWDEPPNVSWGTAPRGAIFRSRLHEWEAERVE